MSSGCSTTVELTLKNVEPFAQSVNVVVQKDDWDVERTIPVGIIDGEAQKRLEPFTVDNGARFLVESALPGSGTLFVQSTAVYGTPDPLPLTMALRHQSGTLLDDHQAAVKLLTALRRAAPQAGAYPMDLDIALQKKLNTLVILDDGVNGPKEVFSLSPEQFGITAAAEVAASSGVSEVDEVTISGAALAGVAAASPFYRFLRTPLQSGDICRMKWVFEGGGLVEEKGAGDAGISAAFAGLSEVVKAQIRDILELNKSARLYYVNGAYLVKRVRLGVEKGRKLAAGTKVDLGDVITPSGIYRFGVELESTREWNDLVVYLVGEEVEVSLVPRPALASMTFEAARPLVTGSVAFDIEAHLAGKKRVILPQSLNAAMAKPR